MNRSIRPVLLAAVSVLAVVPAGVAAAATAPTTTPATAAASSASAAAAPTTAPAKLQLVLPLSADTAGLARFAAAVSTPGSPRYHHYASIAWLSRHFGASSASADRVVAYLRSAGASDVRIDRTGLFVDAALPTATAQRLFGTSLAAHGDRAGANVAPASPATVPAALAGAVTGVVGLDSQPLVGSDFGDAATSTAASDRADDLISGPLSWDAAGTAAGTATSTTAAAAPPAAGYGPTSASSGYLTPAAGGGTPVGCTKAVSIGGFTPNEYLGAYDYGGLQSQQDILGQGERVALIEIDGFSKSNVDTFASCFGLRDPNIVAFRTNHAVSSKGLPAGGEATLDIELLTAAAPDLKQIDVYESTSDIASALEAMTAPLQNSGYKPEVISASLGLCEPQVRQIIGLGGFRDVEAALEEAAASGISVLAAAGDAGSADCISDNADGLPDPELAVNYPASSPYVTSVGGTNVVLNSANQLTEQVVWNDGAASPGSAGGGGFSSIFARPAYQDAVNHTDHREVPDVSGLADIRPGYDIYCTAVSDCLTATNHNPWIQFGGTSASTPLLAGGLALVDQELRLHKRQTLGLVNPLLYELGTNAAAAPEVFDDVTVGSNDVGPFIQADHQPLGGYSAAPGYDAASGWGSVNVGALATLALTLEPGIVNIAEAVPANRSAASSGVIYDTVRCSGACEIGAYADILIGRSKGDYEQSGVAHLTAAGSRLIKIPIPKTELTRIRTALAQHVPVKAGVVGVIVDPAGDVENRTPAHLVTITS